LILSIIWVLHRLTSIDDYFEETRKTMQNNKQNEIGESDIIWFEAELLIRD